MYPGDGGGGLAGVPRCPSMPSTPVPAPERPVRPGGVVSTSASIVRSKQGDMDCYSCLNIQVVLTTASPLLALLCDGVPPDDAKTKG